MANIVLRNLEDSLKEKLPQRAARDKRSMNAELREIVQTALTRPRHGTTSDAARPRAKLTASKHESTQPRTQLEPSAPCSAPSRQTEPNTPRNYAPRPQGS